MTRKSYVRFVPGPRSVEVHDLHGGVLGEIGWYPSWRQNVFIPEPNTLFSHDCMEDIAAYLVAMNAERSSKQGALL